VGPLVNVAYKPDKHFLGLKGLQRPPGGIVSLDLAPDEQVENLH
jgi:hypothetical protein